MKMSKKTLDEVVETLDAMLPLSSLWRIPRTFRLRREKGFPPLNYNQRENIYRNAASIEGVKLFAYAGLTYMLYQALQ